MNDLIDLGFYLDNIGNYKEADNLIKIATKSLMKKKILIPNDVKEIAAEAYNERNKSVKFGSPKDIEMARKLKYRVYLDLDEVMEVFEYTVKNKNSHLKNKKSKSYLEWTLYGGNAGRDWSERIIRLYLPEKWRNF